MAVPGAIADAAGVVDPLDAAVVRNYWVGGPCCGPSTRMRCWVGCGPRSPVRSPGFWLRSEPGEAVAHHSFHVFAVYPWIRFLDRGADKPVEVMQACRVRWGTVASVHGDHAMIESQPLQFADGGLRLGDPVPERVRWRKDGTALAPEPVPGQTVSAHWDWVCGSLHDGEVGALATATQRSLDIVNAASAEAERRAHH